MAKVRVVNTARRRPGKCAVSSDSTGPFLDTGKDVPRYGRIYLSVKWVKQRLSDAGELNEATEDSQDVEELKSRIDELELVETNYDNLIDALIPLLPEQEPEVQEVEKVVPRDPTDEEIENFIATKGANHPAVKNAKALEKGSTEEWYSLYGDKTAVTPQEVADEVHEEPIHPDEPMVLFSIHDQEINLDTVLDQNIRDVLTFSEDKGEGFHAALARRELFVADREGRSPRKGILAALGFWNDETGEPVVPTDAQQGGGVTPTGQDGGVEGESGEENVPGLEHADASDLGPRTAAVAEHEDETLRNPDVREELEGDDREAADALFGFSDDEYGEDEVEDDETGEDE